MDAEVSFHQPFAADFEVSAYRDYKGDVHVTMYLSSGLFLSMPITEARLLRDRLAGVLADLDGESVERRAAGYA